MSGVSGVSVTDRTIIVAVSPEGVIGLGGKIPWHYAGDLRRFKRITMGGTLIMGRRTWESIGQKPLPGRRNIVITHRPIPQIDCFDSIEAALKAADGAVWIIGGAQIYEAAMSIADRIDVTYVPDRVSDPEAVRFPEIDPLQFEVGPLLPHEDDPRLSRRVYTRRTLSG